MIDSYHTWLRQITATCKFHDDREIKSQIIQRCTSQRLRRHALRETMTLQQTLDFSRSLEISEREAAGMESKRQNAVREEVKIVCNWQKQRGGKTQSKRQQKPSASPPSKINKCFYCNGEYPHQGLCPAKGKTC